MPWRCSYSTAGWLANNDFEGSRNVDRLNAFLDVVWDGQLESLLVYAQYLGGLVEASNENIDGFNKSNVGRFLN